MKFLKGGLNQKTYMVGGSNTNENLFARGRIGYSEQDIGISVADRRYMVYVIGRTGMGKSTLLYNLLVQDLRAGRGLCLIDPHGDLAEAVVKAVPKHRKNEVIYLNTADVDHPIGMNVFKHDSASERHLIAANLMSVFRKSWADFWGPRMSYLLHNSILALIEYPDSTLLWLVRLLTDEDFRQRVIERVSDPVVKHYWQKEFTKIPKRELGNVLSPVQNKIGAYLTNRPLRNILSQTNNEIDFNDLLNNKKILIVNLAKGKIGEDAANLLGSLLVTKIQLAAMARAGTPEDERQDFYLYVDEFHNFTTESFADILAEVRKYRLNLVLANQYLGQLDDTIRDAVLANAGTLITFRVGPEDALILQREFEPHYTWTQLVNLSAYEICYKLMNNGEIDRAYTATTLKPMTLQNETPQETLEDIIQQSRMRYSRDRKKVEQSIKTFLSPNNKPRLIMKK